MLALSTNPLLQPAALTVAGVESELCRLPHLAGDLRFVATKTRRDYRDARQADDAAQAIDRIPGADEAFHLAISGRFALWHMVPAILKLSRQRIEALTIATLGFSKRNITALAEMLDDGRIGHARLLASHYFKGTSGDIYDHAAKEFGKRPGRAQFLSLRTRAKLMLLKLTDGRTLTIESSANLRSCKNIEQMIIAGDPGLYQFHLGWISELFSKAGAV